MGWMSLTLWECRSSLEFCALCLGADLCETISWEEDAGEDAEEYVKEDA
jgi:hypothetical protein